MTEAEWLGCTHVTQMLEFARTWLSNRKLRLFACASCRRIRDRHTDEAGRRAVEVMERFADGLATEEERQRAETQATESARRSPLTGFAKFATDPDAFVAAVSTAMVTAGLVSLPQRRAGTWVPGTDPEGCRLLRDMIANPFRPAVAVPPSVLRWDGGTVPKLVRAIYEEQAFDRLPVLGDALEEAGWADTEGLRHCRQPGEHVRGCWVVDLLLGKK